MARENMAALETWDPKGKLLNVIIETTKGSRNKLRYNEEEHLFELAKVLPRGLVFPFDFGFIPSTVGDDGDPLDILVLLDEPVVPGCKVPARVVGVIEAEQTEGGQTDRNDRLIAVAECCNEHKEIRSLDDLSVSLLKEIEHFFISYNQIAGKQFKPIGRHGPEHAKKLVREASKRYQEANNESDERAPTAPTKR